MKWICKQVILIVLCTFLLLGHFLPISNLNTISSAIPTSQAQSAVDSIKSKIRTVVSAADGKVTLATKNRLIELIAGKIKTSSSAVIIDIYVFFLKEVKSLRTIDEVVSISALGNSNPGTTQPNITPSSGPDFAVSFAHIPEEVTTDQKFATVSIKIKNHGSTYNPDSFGSLKFGCKGIDGNIYPYRSYTDNQTIGNETELALEIPNVYIGNLTSNKGFKLLTCKVDSSDLIAESNEDNNYVNVSVQIY